MSTVKNYRCINMDAASVETLERIMADDDDPRNRVAELMLAARGHRLNGNIEQALRVERRVENAIAGDVPQRLRW